MFIAEAHTVTGEDSITTLKSVQKVPHEDATPNPTGDLRYNLQ
jgi:hypothetical protein